MRRFAASPVLEGRTDRERGGEAVRLLMGKGARRRLGLGEASVAMVGTIGTGVALVLEGHERAGR